jgi:hypothetical protein
MNLKKISCLAFLGILVFMGVVVSAQTVSDDFRSKLTERQIKDISIMIPDYLKEEVSQGQIKGFVADTKTKTIIVLVEDEPLTAELKKVVSTWYEFWEKSFDPVTNPAYKIWNSNWKSQYTKIEKMERVDFGDFHGFLTKGIVITQDSEKFIYDYILFDKDTGNKYITIRFASMQNYFLTDEESNYIASTIKRVKTW